MSCTMRSAGVPCVCPTMRAGLPATIEYGIRLRRIRRKRLLRLRELPLSAPPVGMPSLGDLLLAHDYEAAVGPVEAAVSNASPTELPTLLLLLGAVQERLGKRDLARSAWRRALALEGFDAVSWSGNLVHTSGSLLASREAMRALITANNGRVDGGDARLLDLVGILARDTGPRGAPFAPSSTVSL